MGSKRKRADEVIPKLHFRPGVNDPELEATIVGFYRPREIAVALFPTLPQETDKESVSDEQPSESTVDAEIKATVDLMTASTVDRVPKSTVDRVTRSTVDREPAATVGHAPQSIVDGKPASTVDLVTQSTVDYEQQSTVDPGSIVD